MDRVKQTHQPGCQDAPPWQLPSSECMETSGKNHFARETLNKPCGYGKSETNSSISLSGSVALAASVFRVNGNFCEKLPEKRANQLKTEKNTKVPWQNQQGRAKTTKKRANCSRNERFTYRRWNKGLRGKAAAKRLEKNAKEIIFFDAKASTTDAKKQKKIRKNAKKNAQQSAMNIQ